ncbi:MAG TPA: hypothetical protein VLQ92_09180, partial [Candidatus Limnocylindrales bacterium]|nr:hypothetical protein [Candidatus Limnocylindrales bacterium]
VLTTALSAEHLWDLSEIVSTELALIDSTTNIRHFIQERRGQEPSEATPPPPKSWLHLLGK